MENKKKPELVGIIGHTAAGKTGLAANLAAKLDGEVISADSRQVYRQMDIGTGKDFQDYKIDERTIPSHLIDITDPGYEYNVYEYQKDFLNVFNDLLKRGKLPVLCGGTGMYIEAVLKGYQLINVPHNTELRKSLESESNENLIKLLRSFKIPHNITDTESRKRLIRAIEIASFYEENEEPEDTFPEFNYLLIGVKFDRESRRKRITERLKQRLEAGMIEETKNLLDSGIPAEKLIYYGLEYKYLTLYLTGKLSYDDMFRLLNTAIHQYAKRQMTWFRKMERDGFQIHWLDGHMSPEDKISTCLMLYENFKI